MRKNFVYSICMFPSKIISAYPRNTSMSIIDNSSVMSYSRVIFIGYLRI